MKVIEAHVTLGFGRKMGHLGMEGPQVPPPKPFIRESATRETFVPLLLILRTPEERMQVTSVIAAARPVPSEWKTPACQPGPTYSSAQGNF